MCEKIKEKKGGTPCEGCLPDLLPGNVQIMDIFYQVQHQLVFNPGGKPVDINLEALDRYLKRHGIEDADTFDRVLIVARKSIELSCQGK